MGSLSIGHWLIVLAIVLLIFGTLQGRRARRHREEGGLTPC
jgi:Sec-independent protein translocase protein TatA